MRNAGYKVVITGEGSDEILGGYAHFRRDMLLYNREGQDPDVVAALLEDLERLNPVSRGLLLPHGEREAARECQAASGLCSLLDRNLLRPVVKDARFAGRRLSSRSSGSARASMRFFSDLDVRGQLAGRDPVHQSLYLWAKTLLPSYILTMLGDRMEMAHSIEGRVPFLDHHVVEVIRSQPVTQKIRGMTEKYVLREAVRDVITDTVYRQAEAPVSEPARYPESRGEAQHVRAGHASRPCARLHPVLRSEEGHRPSGQS